MKLLLVPVVLAALGQAGDDPVLRMKAMEEKIARADVLQVDFDCKFDGGKDKTGAVKGTLTVGAANKLRLDATMKFNDMEIKLDVVSDGKQLATSAGGLGAKSQETPKHLRAAFTVVLARTGVGAALMNLGKKDDNENPLETIKVSDVKKVKTEKVGDRDALAVAYKLTVKDMTIAATVWIDLNTNLPLKRTLRAEKDSETLTITETYSNFRINPKLDGNPFQLPK